MQGVFRLYGLKTPVSRAFGRRLRNPAQTGMVSRPTVGRTTIRKAAEAWRFTAKPDETKGPRIYGSSYNKALAYLPHLRGVFGRTFALHEKQRADIQHRDRAHA